MSEALHAELPLGTKSRGEEAARNPAVVSSSELLRGKEAEIKERKHSRQRKTGERSVQLPSDGDHGNDLMTPPEVLLQKAQRDAKQFTKEKKGEAAIQQWVKATALSRIVHGDTHWHFAQCHIQLGKTYLELQDLPEQALTHATKGRTILLHPGSHVTSHDPSPEAIYSLAVAHCITGRVLTIQGKLAEAENSLLRAEKTSEKYSKMPGGGADTQIDLDIASAMGRLSMKQGKYDVARDCFKQAVELTKAVYGASHGELVPLLKELAAAEHQTSDKTQAITTLEEALQIAESSHGSDSEQVAGVLVHLARLHGALLQDGRSSSDAGHVEEMMLRACTILATVCGPCHEKTISCQEELCRILLSRKETQANAIPRLKEVISAKKRTFGDPSQEVADSYKILGTVYLVQGKVEEARKYLSKAKDMYGFVLGAKHKETVSLSRTLEEIAGSPGKDTSKELESRPRFKTVV